MSKYLKYLLFFSLFLCFGSCTSQDDASETVFPNPIETYKIVAFGDSTTATRSTIEAVYAQRLPSLLNQMDIKNVVFNAGVGGSHTGFLSDNNRHNVQHARDRFKSAVLGHSPDLVIMCFGINDSWIDTGQTISRISLEKYESNLRYMLGQLAQKEINIILMTPNTFGSRYESWRYERTEMYAEKVRVLAAELKFPLIDQWKLFEEYGAVNGQSIDDLLLDGMHPNDKWHEQLGLLLVDKIVDLIE